MASSMYGKYARPPPKQRAAKHHASLLGKQTLADQGTDTSEVQAGAAVLAKTHTTTHVLRVGCIRTRVLPNMYYMQASCQTHADNMQGRCCVPASHTIPLTSLSCPSQPASIGLVPRNWQAAAHRLTAQVSAIICRAPCHK